MKLKDAIERLAIRLDGIEYEVDASVYTLTDEEYGTVLYVRDELFALAKLLGEKK